MEIEIYDRIMDKYEKEIEQNWKQFNEVFKKGGSYQEYYVAKTIAIICEQNKVIMALLGQINDMAIKYLENRTI